MNKIVKLHQRPADAYNAAFNAHTAAKNAILETANALEAAVIAVTAEKIRVGELLGSALSKHLYSVETNLSTIEVNADSRAQAEKLTKEAGFLVRSVNMIG
ncbi:MAG: hypothetical protein Q7S87_03300 [Agitococcus sp.]|nr:hypothetical protein [Agitococcus sp.]MDO9178662.1 hypothetical protein [Agitococcus sp.]